MVLMTHWKGMNEKELEEIGGRKKKQFRRMRVTGNHQATVRVAQEEVELYYRKSGTVGQLCLTRGSMSVPNN